KGLRTVVLTGPFMTEPDQRRFAGFARPHTQIMSFVAGLESLIAAADVVVGRAGYNTVCEALGGGTPAVLVPRVLHRDEQRLRACRPAGRALNVREGRWPERHGWH